VHDGDTPWFYNNPMKTYSEGACTIYAKQRICPKEIWIGFCKKDLVPSNNGSVNFNISFDVEVIPANAWSVPTSIVSLSPNNNFVISSVLNNALKFSVDKTGALYAKDAFIEGDINATSGIIGGCSIVDGIL
jgi:hypothetical protein